MNVLIFLQGRRFGTVYDGKTKHYGQYERKQGLLDLVLLLTPHKGMGHGAAGA